MARRNQTADPHRAYSSDGIKLALGLHWKDGIVHVAAVPDGTACGCECPACGRKLIAKQGTRRRHFAHARLEGDGDAAFRCDGGHMTALHLFAQNLLVDRKMLLLPPVAGGHGSERIERFPVRTMTFETSDMEQTVGSLKPDVTLTTGVSTLYVEVLVTHACSPEKIDAMRAGRHALLEIDLTSTDRDVSLPGLEDWILNRAPRRWLSNRHIDEIEAEIAERRRADAARRERQLATAALRLSASYRKAEMAALAHDPQSDSNVRRAEEGGWKRLVSGFDALAPGLFAVHPERWRVTLLTEVLTDGFDLTVIQIRAALRREGLLNVSLIEEMTEELAVSRRAGLPATDVDAVIDHYLAALEQMGAAERLGDRWRRDPSVSLLLEAQRNQEFERVREKKQRRERIDRFVDLLDDLRRGLPPELADDFEEREHAWRDAPFGGTSPLRIAVEGGSALDDLTKALSAIAACMRDGGDGIAPPTLGLPHVGDAMERAILKRQERINARNERERLQQEEKVRDLERQAEARSTSIRNDALTRLFESADDWLARTLPRSGLTPEATARRSHDDLYRAQDALESAVRRRHQRLNALEELEAFAARHVPDEETRHYLLKSGHPKVPGWISMLAYCRDADTLQVCKDIIKPPKTPKR